MKKLSLVCFCALILLATTETFAQGTLFWNQKVTLVHRTSNDPGATTAFGRLYISFAGTDGNRTVNVISSADGFFYDGGPGPISGKRSEYGVRLAYNPDCNSLFVAYIGRDGNKKVNVTTSSDGGATWPAQISFGVSIGDTATDSPAITLLSNGKVGVAWGALVEAAGPGGGFFHSLLFRELDCNLMPNDPNVSNDTCFWDFTTCNNFNSDEPNFVGSPAWVGTGDLRSITQNPTNPMLFKFGPSGAPFSLGANWSPEGPSLTYNPGESYYVAWRGGDNRINVGNLSTGAHLLSFDTSPSAPAILVFNNQLFVVWRGNDNKVNVASTNLF